MSGREEDAREKMVKAAASLLSETGFSGASFSNVIERSGAPRGSIYHHFPSGKEQLAGEAITFIGEHVARALRALEPTAPETIIRSFGTLWRANLQRTDNKAGCAIAAVANAHLTVPELAKQADEIFITWASILTEKLAQAGMKKDAARKLGTFIIASFEGALVLCRAAGSTKPLQTVEDMLVLAARSV